MDAGVGNETLFIRDLKECAVSDARLICHSTRVSAPRIKMRIEMNHRDWPIDFIECTEDGENDGVVTTKTRAAICEDMVKGTA